MLTAEPDFVTGGASKDMSLVEGGPNGGPTMVGKDSQFKSAPAPIFNSGTH